MGETMSEHTPGPWKPMTDAVANARLIAAAPDMLKALTIALGFIEEFEADHRSRTKTGDTIRAAIAKARGEAK
jgi:hypothetical protein